MDYRKNVPSKFPDIDSMSKDNARKEIEKLRDAVNYHDHLYYGENKPKISDSAYDRLFHRLQELEEKFPEFQTANSPTSRIGAEPVGSLKKRRHTTVMQSLQAAIETDTIESFDSSIRSLAHKKKIEYVAEPKFDGLSVELVYTKGELEYAATRGDGRTGEDITNNVRTMRSVPLKLNGGGSVPERIAVRGEILMTKTGFQKLNRERVGNNKESFANPRNAAAGTVRQLDSKNVAGLPLDIFCYELLQISEKEPETHLEALDFLKSLGLKTTRQRQLCSSVDDLLDFRESMAKKRESIDFDIDGIVAKINNRSLRNELGSRGRSPRWAFAWKFPPRQEVTRQFDIVVQVGRTGILTPVALLEPVDIGGVTISRATLHNEDEVHRKDIRVGDNVRIARAGDVIPEVIERVPEKGKKRGTPFSMPKKCPSCGDPIVREGAYHICPAGLSCRAQLEGRLRHFASRSACNIETLGGKTTEQLVERNMINDLADLFGLSVEDFMQLDGYAEKSAKKLHDQIQNAKNIPLDRFIYALGIRHIGEHMARVLAHHFESFDKVRSATLEQLSHIREIGDESAQSIVEFFGDKRNNESIDRMLSYGVNPQPVSRKKAQKLKGTTIVLTGELDKWTRSEAKQRIEALGGRATSSVSDNTDYLVAGQNPGSKLDAARKHNVKVIDEKEFENMVG
ncbi:MAG: NAD-dependent DNA ligase LigA [Chitinivibrionales bacterium]|nr:NAD-dependent DNA ligase LigA [Chitinivibrionales bacterium]